MDRLTTEYCGEYVPKALCSIDRLGGVDDCDLCFEYCKALEDGNVDCRGCAISQCFKKLGQYENLEEQGLLLKFPCSIGSDVYFIPSKVNFKLNKLGGHEENNRVYHQKVARITFTERGWHMECDKDLEYGTDHILVDMFYKETWFLSQQEADEALKEMESEESS